MAPYQAGHPNGELVVTVKTMGLLPRHAYDQGTGYIRQLTSLFFDSFGYLPIERELISYAKIGSSFVSYSFRSLFILDAPPPALHYLDLHFG